MSSNLDALIQKLNSTPSYTAKTENELRAEAERYYASTYEAQKLAAQHTYDESELGLKNQLAALQASYDNQRKESAKSYENALATTARSAVGRGMQRSSYLNATLGNLVNEGVEAQNEINAAQGVQENAINSQMALYGRQLAQQLESLTKQEQMDVLARLDELNSREYDRTIASQNTQNDLAMAIYQFQFEKEQADREYEMWKAEFDAKYGGSGGSGGSSGSRKTTSSTSTKRNSYQQEIDSKIRTPAKAAGSTISMKY